MFENPRENYVVAGVFEASIPRDGNRGVMYKMPASSEGENVWKIPDGV